MELLFTVDMKDYDGNEPVVSKTACRGIIWKDGRLALVHSLTYGYYKFPGGGMKKMETFFDTLKREVREESGLDVIKGSECGYGMVKRIEKGQMDYLLLQDSYYFTCEVSDIIHPQELTKKEAAAGFVLEFVDPEKAIAANDAYLSTTSYGAVLRDNRVLRMLCGERDPQVHE